MNLKHIYFEFDSINDRFKDEYDIIDEAIDLYRANCLFKNFEITGPGDRVLVYLTLFIQGINLHSSF